MKCKYKKTCKKAGGDGCDSKLSPTYYCFNRKPRRKPVKSVERRALDLALQHAINQDYVNCYEIDCPKSKDDNNRCFNPKDYVCKRYMAKHYLALAKASIKEKK